MSTMSTGTSDWERADSGAARAAYSVREVAGRLGVSDATIWRLLRKGTLRSVKVGSLRRITAKSLQEMLVENPV